MKDQNFGSQQSVAASVLLKNSCLHMNAFQILMNTLMHHSSQTVSILYTVFHFFKRQKKAWKVQHGS